MRRKKLKIDLSKNDISQEIKNFILEQSKIIEKLKTELKELKKKNKNLKRLNSKEKNCLTSTIISKKK